LEDFLMMKTWNALTLSVIVAGVLGLAGCNKKAAQATPPTPPPSPAAPTATLAASPEVIQQGQSATLTWQTNNASDITIEGLGAVSASGSKTVSPGSSTTYTLTAKGPGGSQNASARVTVNAKMAAAPQPSDADLFARNVKDVRFDYDKANLRTDQAPVAQSDAAFLVQHPAIKVNVEGHCDDRGSEEYNLALGTSRAETLKKSLLEQGVSSERIKTVSYGKERPFCTEDNQQCWAQNRVDHIALAQ
jgi:peptidoglycan-associated lipoprotein